MKDIAYFFSIIALSVSVRAASLPTGPEVVVLPTIEVRAPRTLPAEERVNESLRALRQEVQPFAIGAIQLPLFEAQAAKVADLDNAGPIPAGNRLAKS